MDYRSIIESKYNRANWQKLLHDIFKQRIEFWSVPTPVIVDKDMAKSALYTGKITLPDGHIIAVYEVELSDSVVIERNRAGIRNLLCSSWRSMGCAGAFMFCFRQDEAVLRFSYVSESLAFTEDGTVAKESTDTKRFTYLLGEGHRSRTAIEQFEKLKASALNLKDITKAFSVEALSDLFFREYKKHYEDIIEFITGKRMVKVANKWEEKVTGSPCTMIMQEFACFPDAEKAVRDYVKKLMGRLVFIQFLQKKGWMGCPAGDSWTGGDKEFVQNLFERTPFKDTFVDDVLEPMFNDINSRRDGDIANEVLGHDIKIPYLNGGLFERDSYDKTDFPLPAKYMKALLDFLASYNFTIDENDPDDAEIGVDPEMLGRIFENLLEDNKDKGAFYTPKEIVNYMCRESLIAYLQTDIEDETKKESFRQFVTTHDVSVLNPGDVYKVDKLLRDVKICDPAIGSGAFPIGLLRELSACRMAIEGLEPDTTIADVKKDIIQNSIYGVDIEKGAVDIARLRFWLSLIIDEQTPHALPNMDFKIMQGNSLLEQFEGIDLSGMSLNEQAKKKAKKGQAWIQTIAFDEQDSLDNIQQAIREYYSTEDHSRKLHLRKVINDNVKSYIINLKGFTPEIKAKLDNLPIPNDQFFLWHIYFKEVFDNGGFDIVIGNPPYGAKLSEKDKVLFKDLFSDVHMRTPETFCYFISQSIRLSKSNNSIISYIVPNNLFFQNENEKTRELLIYKNRLLRAINLGDSTFENADVPTCIFLTSTGKKDSYTISYSDYRLDKISSIDWNHGIELIENNVLKNIPAYSLGMNTKEVSLLNKVSTLGITINEIAEEMACGISTGGNKAFSISRTEAVEKELERDVIHKVLFGYEIDKYKIDSDDNIIIYMQRDMKEKDYPNVLSHLAPYKEKLAKRSECKKGILPWWVMNRPRYSRLFEEPKIIMRQTSDSIRCVYDDSGYYVIDSILVLKTKNKEYDYNYIVGVLNSCLTNFIYQGLTQEAGRAFAQVKPANVRKLYIPKVTQTQQVPIITLVDRIIAAKKVNPLADTTTEEREIDRLVYELYGLTDEEIAIVEGTK